MTSSLHNFDDGLTAAIDGGNWRAASALGARLGELLLGAFAAHDAVRVAAIRGVLGRAEDRMVYGRGADTRLSETGVAALLKSYRALADSAADVCRTAFAEDEDLRSARDKLLDAMAGSERPMSNTALVTATGLPPETVSRVLKLLRAEGLVNRWRASRHKMNVLTTKGMRLRAGAKAVKRTPVIERDKNPLDLLKAPSAALQDKDKLRADPILSLARETSSVMADGDGGAPWAKPSFTDFFATTVDLNPLGASKGDPESTNNPDQLAKLRIPTAAVIASIATLRDDSSHGWKK